MCQGGSEVQVVERAETQLVASQMVFQSLAAVGDVTENLKGAMFEMTRLEEGIKMINHRDGQHPRAPPSSRGQITRAGLDRARMRRTAIALAL